LKVRYTPDAIADLREVLAHIEKQSPQGARKVQARIQRLINLTLDHPKWVLEQAASGCAVLSLARIHT
jgi:plasmid stabilization system protein ParE